MDTTDDDESSSSSSLELKTLDISNDQYYKAQEGFKPKQEEDAEEIRVPIYGSKTLRHSLPAYNLWRPFFPTYLNEEKFRTFHRPKLRHYNTGPQALTRFRKPKAFPIKSLTRTLHRFQKKLRNKVINAINNGMNRDEIIKKILLIREAKDLTAKQGELFLFEYSEEYPPVLNQIGMASNIKIFKQPPAFRKTKTTDHSNTSQKPETVYGTQVIGNYKVGIEEDLASKTRTKPIYYHQPKPSAEFKVIENNMFRAPLYEHHVPDTDFLIVRTRNNFYIRGVRVIFTVGQMMPLVAVPQPTESAIRRFRVDLSNIYIHKMFMESDTEPATINFDLLARLFPDYDQAVLSRRLTSNGAFHKKIGKENLYFRGSSKFGLTQLIEHRRSFTPEQYCLNMAMLAARQRLRELNYTESMIIPPNDVELETEVLAAPWNTSKAVLGALTNRHHLDLKRHLIDPTGHKREGFSCVAWSKSPTEDDCLKSRQSNLNSLLLEKDKYMYKIKKEKLERLAIYQKEAQIISEIQSKVLSSNETLSSDDEEGDDIEVDENNLDASYDEQLRDLDKLVIGGQTMDELNFEKEEEERREMMKRFVSDENTIKGNMESKNTTNPNSEINAAAFTGKILKINRTYMTSDGEIQRTEIVREPKIIALYVKEKGGSVQANQNNINTHKVTESNLLKNIPNELATSKIEQGHGRRKSVSLAPTELCRAEGIVLTISKSVLDVRAMRNFRRMSRMAG